MASFNDNNFKPKLVESKILKKIVNNTIRDNINNECLEMKVKKSLIEFFKNHTLLILFIIAIGIFLYWRYLEKKNKNVDSDDSDSEDITSSS